MASLSSIAAILVTYRPLTAGFGHFAQNKWSVQMQSVPQKALINGHDCFCLEFISVSNPLLAKRCWIAPDMAYVILRLEGSKAFYVDIYYRLDTSLGWVPDRWNITTLSGDLTRVELLDSAVVTNARINPVIQEDDFTFAFPPGTEVADNSRRDVEPYRYISREGQRKRVITIQERSANIPYSRLLATEPKTSWPSASVIATAIVLAITALFVGYITIRRRNRESH